MRTVPNQKEEIPMVYVLHLNTGRVYGFDDEQAATQFIKESQGAFKFSEHPITEDDINEILDDWEPDDYIDDESMENWDDWYDEQDDEYYDDEDDF